MLIFFFEYIKGYEENHFIAFFISIENIYKITINYFLNFKINFLFFITYFNRIIL